LAPQDVRRSLTAATLGRTLTLASARNSYAEYEPSCPSIQDDDTDAGGFSRSVLNSGPSQRMGPKETHPPRTRLFKLWQATTWAKPSSARDAGPTSARSFLLRPGSSETDPSRLSSANSRVRLGTAGSSSCDQSASAQPSIGQLSEGSTLTVERGTVVRSLTCKLGVTPKKAEEKLQEEDGMVSILPPQDWLYLMDGAQCWHTFHPTKAPKRDIEYVEKFEDACRRRYSTLILTWRWLLDYEGVGRVTFQSFSKNAREMGFKEPKRLWSYLNTRKTSFLTLDEWDPMSFRCLFEFRSVCLEQYGGMDTAFKFGMDKTGSRTCTMPEMEQFCEDNEFSGDVKALFASLDMRQKTFITLDDLDFLMKWEGQKHAHLEQHFDFHFARVGKRRREQALQKAKVADLLPRLASKTTSCGTPRRPPLDNIGLASVMDEVCVDDLPPI